MHHKYKILHSKKLVIRAYPSTTQSLPLDRPGHIQVSLTVIGLLLAHLYSTVSEIVLLQPFYGSLDFLRDNPGEPVPEKTFTHSQ